MTELAIPYSITSPSGLRLVVGNSDTAKADPDWIGWLDPENGITGLLDGAEIQASILKRPRAAGVLMGPGLRGERSGTIQGVIDPNVSATIVEQRAQKIRRVMAEIEKADGILRWWPSSDGIGRRLRVRNVARPDVRGRRPKTFMLTLSSRDPYVLGDTLQTRRVSLPNLTTGWSGVFITGGEELAWPVFRVYGPITNPRITDGLGTQIAIDVVVGVNEYLLVIPERGVAYKGTVVGGATVNEIANPSIEVNSTGHTGMASDGGAMTTAARQTGWAKAGAASFRITRTVAHGQYIMDGIAQIPVVPGEIVSSRVTLNILTAAQTTAHGIIEFFGAAGYLGASAGTTPASSTSSGAVPRIVDLIARDAVVPAGATTMRVLPYLINGAGVAATLDAYIDAVRIVRGAGALATDEYLDGDIAGHRWASTRHASASTRLVDAGVALVPVAVRMDLTKWFRLRAVEDISLTGTGTAHAVATPGLEVDWRATWA